VNPITQVQGIINSFTKKTNSVSPVMKNSVSANKLREVTTPNAVKFKRHNFENQLDLTYDQASQPKTKYKGRSMLPNIHRNNTQ
jgi:hypothetical protein